MKEGDCYPNRYMFILEYEVFESSDYGGFMSSQTEYFKTYDEAIDFIACSKMFLDSRVNNIISSSDKTFKVINLYSAESIDYQSKLDEYIENVHKIRLNREMMKIAEERFNKTQESIKKKEEEEYKHYLKLRDKYGRFV